MNNCRVCNAEIKPYQIFCPKCGAKHPLLNEEELRGFREFKKKFRPIFLITVLMIIIFSVLFFVRIPLTIETPYTVKELPSELKSVDIPLGCTGENYMYSINFIESQIYRDMFEVKCQIENLEDNPGTFEYIITLYDKLSLEEKQKTSEIYLDAYRNETVSVTFEGIKNPYRIDYFCQVKPPKKEICETKTEHAVVTEQKETIKIKKEKVYKSLFELIFLKD